MRPSASIQDANENSDRASMTEFRLHPMDRGTQRKFAARPQFQILGRPQRDWRSLKFAPRRTIVWGGI